MRMSRGQAASSVMETVGHSWRRCGDGSADDAAAFGRGDGGADNETDKELKAWHERLGIAFRMDTVITRVILPSKYCIWALVAPPHCHHLQTCKLLATGIRCWTSLP